MHEQLTLKLLESMQATNGYRLSYICTKFLFTLRCFMCLFVTICTNRGFVSGLVVDDCTQDEFRCLQRELDIMKRLQPHPNIIALLGCCTKSSVYQILTHRSFSYLVNKVK